MLRDLLNQEGITIARRHVATLMKRMGLEALYRKPNTSKGPVAKFVSRPRSGRIVVVFKLGSPRKVRPRPPLSPPFSNFATGPVWAPSASAWRAAAWR